MTDHHEGFVDDIWRSRARRERFDAWLEQLRGGDERFAAASLLRPADAGAWQAATYLLTGCDVVWTRVGVRVLANGSFDAVVEALAEQQSWTARQRAVMRWGTHFGDEDHGDAPGYPWVFGEFCFRRWVTAVHLRQGLAPALTIMDQRR